MLAGPQTYAQTSAAPQTPDTQETTAQLIWDFVETREALTLALRQRDGAGEIPFFAACAENGDLDLWTGAPMDKISEAGKPVTISLRADNLTADIAGKSELFQPTGNMRLFAKVRADDKFFDVLASGKRVEVIRPASSKLFLQPADPQTVKLFVEACKTRSEH